MNKTRNTFLLFLTACIWGMAFVSQSKGMEYMHAFTFNGVRSLIGAAVLFLYILLTGKLKKRKVAGTEAGEGSIAVNWPMTLKAGLWCGLILTAASTLQQFGIKYTTVGKAGFITTLYIIFVPLAGIFFKKKVLPRVWVAAVMAAVGMYLLCLTDSFQLDSGDIMVFLCAVFFTAHIMVIDHYAPHTDGVIVSCIQFLVCGVICCVAALIWGHPTFAQISGGLGTLLYAGALSCGVGYTLQIVGQRGVNPTVASLIMSLESVVATAAGWAAYRIGFLAMDQTLTGRQIGGCAVVLAAVVLVQLPERGEVRG